MPRSATFAPLAHRVFALLMLGVLLTNLGNTVQSVGAAWLLTAQGEPADVVALVQTAINLPILLLALPAGAWADTTTARLAASQRLDVAGYLADNNAYDLHRRLGTLTRTGPTDTNVGDLQIALVY